MTSFESLPPLPTEIRLAACLRQYAPLGIAFSGGLDSSVLALFASKVLSPDQILLLHLDTHTSAAGEDESCRKFADQFHLRLIALEHSIFEHAQVRENGPDRCYHCKKILMRCALDAAMGQGIAVLCDGVNSDDLGDWRPGIRASDELGVQHPFLESGFGKRQIRLTGRRLGLPDYMRQSSACMASRIPVGTPLDESTIRRATTAESQIRDLGFPLVRVRVMAHDEAKVELHSIFLRKGSRLRKSIGSILAQNGFLSFTIAPYCQGAMNQH